MEWHYMYTDPPKVGQKVYIIRQYRKGQSVICEGVYGIMRKDGVHLQFGSGVYSKGPCPGWDVFVWADQEEFNNDLV